MDTSKEYIKMCDCEEIQDGKGRNVSFQNIDREGDWWIQVDIQSTDGHNVWLPRQDQLQEMLNYKEPIVFNLVSNLNIWIMDNPKKVCFSMEQLWLEFVMETKHNKTWDKDKWI